MEINLRPYQRELIDKVYKSWEKHDRVIARLQTGGGKTISFMEMIKELQEWGYYVVIAMRRKSLINQNVAILDDFEIDHGVYQANHRRYAPTKSVQLCSIDTIGARNIFPHADKEKVVVIVDESHDCRPSGRKYKQLVEAYEGKKIVGFTATPFDDNSLFQDIVESISAMELMKKGYLVPAKIFSPDVVDVSEVKVNRMGKFDQDDLFDVCSKSQVVGDIVKNWKKYGQNKRTVLFAVNIEHSKMLCAAFNKAGIKAVHCDADTKDADRKRHIKSLQDDEIKILCNVNVFSTGVDCPEIECIIFARPTKSVVYYLQAIGRGLRTALHIGKTDCTVIDSAGNARRFGSPYSDREATIEKKDKPKGELEDIQVRTCAQCFFMFKATEKVCPECSFTNPKLERKGYEEVEGELVEIQLSDEEKKALKLAEMIRQARQLFFIQRKNKKLGEWFVGRQLIKTYGEEYVMENFQRIDNVFNDMKKRYPDL